MARDRFTSIVVRGAADDRFRQPAIRREGHAQTIFRDRLANVSSNEQPLSRLPLELNDVERRTRRPLDPESVK